MKALLLAGLLMTSMMQSDAAQRTPHHPTEDAAMYLSFPAELLEGQKISPRHLEQLGLKFSCPQEREQFEALWKAAKEAEAQK